jgi:transcriptional regulator with XRE-family HTH domain
VGARERPADIGAAIARVLVLELAREIRQARIDRGLSQAVVAAQVGMSRSYLSRIERGLIADPTVRQLATLLSVTGLRLHGRAYPDGSPVRDAAHLALLGRFRGCLHRSLRWATEVPLPQRGDLRAWDGVVRGPGWTIGVEAETRPRDAQALKRRLLAKSRDGGVDAVVLVLLDSHHNRQLLRFDAEGLRESFRVPGVRALELLRAAVAPGGNAIVLL